MTFGSLFSGIGGMDLGLERAGMQCRWQVEIDPFVRRVLAKHWPDVPKHDDVRTFPNADTLDEWRRLKVDLVAGGFPCQDISEANAHGDGLDGERSGLWREFARILRVLRPRYALVENVAALTFRGMGRVLADLSALGFDAEWSVISACSLGAPHTRDRMFIVAHAETIERRPVFADGGDMEGGELLYVGRTQVTGWRGIPHEVCDRPWTVEPSIYGVAHGVPNRMDRINGTGNAVVPQVAEWIGRRIMEHARTTAEVQHAGAEQETR